jgi:hypothetical protein
MVELALNAGGDLAWQVHGVYCYLWLISAVVAHVFAQKHLLKFAILKLYYHWVSTFWQKGMVNAIVEVISKVCTKNEGFMLLVGGQSKFLYNL